MASSSLRTFSSRPARTQAAIELERLLEEDGEYAAANRGKNGGQDDEKPKTRSTDMESSVVNPSKKLTTLKMKNKVTRNVSKAYFNWAAAEDDTEMAGTNQRTYEHDEHNFLVKWQLPGQSDMSKAKQQFIKILVELLATFHDVTFIDHKSREWKIEDTTDEEKFLHEISAVAVQMHPIKDKQQRVIRWIIITKIRARTTISEWKKNDYFYDQVLEDKIYMFPHPFQYEEWDITSIGFIKNVHAVHFTPSHVHDMITELTNHHTLPIFQLIPQKITNQEKTATTRAYTVQCAKASAQQLSRLLTQGEMRKSQLFVPFKYKRTQPELFSRCIKQQNEVYYTTWVIKLEGISKEVMHFILNEIMATWYQLSVTRR